MLKVYTRDLGKTAILCLQGRIVNGETAVLRDAVNSKVDASLIVLDLMRVNTIDAHGLGVMLELREQIQSKGAELKLMNPTNPVSHVLEMTRLNTVFEITSQPELLTVGSHRREATTMELASCTYFKADEMNAA
jgi:anti-anti-sigma factor